MEEIPEHIQRDINTLLHRCSIAKAIVYMELSDESYVALWNGSCSINVYNTQGVEVDFWMTSIKPKNKDHAIKTIKTHYSLKE